MQSYGGYNLYNVKIITTQKDRKLLLIRTNQGLAGFTKVRIKQYTRRYKQYTPSLSTTRSFVRLSTENKQSFIKNIITNRVLLIELGLFCVENPQKSITATRAVDKDEEVKEFLYFPFLNACSD